MQYRRHVMPTHLQVVDKALYGLALGQVMTILIGLALGYGLCQQVPQLSLPLRIGLIAGSGLLAAGVALIRPSGRGLDVWLFVLLRYSARPKRSVWQPAEPQPEAWRSGEGDWIEFAPTLPHRSIGGSISPPASAGVDRSGLQP